jgi:hypothetical protein
MKSMLSENWIQSLNLLIRQFYLSEVQVLQIGRTLQSIFLKKLLLTEDLGALP